MLTIVAAQVLGVLGRGAIVLWAVPAIVSGAAGPDGEVAGVTSYVTVAVTVLASLVATIAWWERADQTG